MERKACTQCGNEIQEENEVFCPDCRALFKTSKKKRLWYMAAGAGVLCLAALLLWYLNAGSWDFSWDALTGKPAAVINGEPVARNDLKERLAGSRIMLERQYGKDLFAGERGRVLLAEMEGEVLGRILEERLVAQEARRMGIQVSDGRVRQELERIGKEIYGSAENFQARLREDGISPSYLMSHIRYQFLCEEIKKLKFTSRTDADADFGAWLAQVRDKAQVTIYRQANLVENVSQSRGGCCGSGGGGSGGGGGCGGSGKGGCGGSKRSGGPVDPELQSRASAAGLAEYRRTNPQDKGVGAKVIDYGCHIQVDIEKSGKIVKSYTYRDGKVFEI